MKKTENKFEELFFLSWKKIAVVALLCIVSVFLHNFISGIFSIEDTVFFIIAVFLIPVYIIFLILYTIIKKLKGGVKW